MKLLPKKRVQYTVQNELNQVEKFTGVFNYWNSTGWKGKNAGGCLKAGLEFLN
jgi:hypothetical protein